MSMITCFTRFVILFRCPSTSPKEAYSSGILVADYLAPARFTGVSPTVDMCGHRLINFRSIVLSLLLATITTLIDVICGRMQPSSFGTHHVALLLAAWGPVIILGKSENTGLSTSNRTSRPPSSCS